ncbi:hypothetical protein C7441_1257 [Pseudaminobacter salicylatoxidans]|uniref:Uncharacterized protein n=1 Tax=Pseudaminobacter salicylatoxidans TaxID=93369 RepID=A0A316BL37_PSESE|nr:hypothetical protein [Pseudaminobacter salicylatoxidans]PWJ73824.1 hypothetical protein C7441_1257 [Pseudaminobacter salicylatoxidans]
MSEKQRVEPWQEIRIRRTDSGWDFVRFDGRNGGSGIYGTLSMKAATFDEAVAKVKEHFDV